MEELRDLILATLTESNALLVSLAPRSISPSPSHPAAHPATATQPVTGTHPATTTILSDLQQLLPQLSKQTTNFSLALKPVLSLPAAIHVAKELHDVLGKVGFAAGLLGKKDGLLGREIGETLIEILESFSKYLLAALSTLPSSPHPTAFTSTPTVVPLASTPKEARQNLLRAHAILHEKLPLFSRLPTSELAAHIRHYNDALGILDDGLEEVGGVIESGCRPDFFGEDSEEDDEDGEGEGRKLEEREMERIKSVFMCLRLGRLLVLRLINSSTAALPPSSATVTPLALPSTVSTPSLSPPPATPTFSAPSFLATTLASLKALTARTDDLASSLTDFPHDTAVMMSLLSEHEEVLGRISTAVQQEVERSTVGTTEEKADEKVLENGEAGKGDLGETEAESKEATEERKWQEMYREQIRKASAKLAVLQS